MAVEPRYRRDNEYRTRKYTSNSRKSAYIDGNTARQLQTEPIRRDEASPQREFHRYHQRRPVKMAGIDGLSCLFLTGALAVVLAVAFSYITLQNDVYAMKNKIVTLQTQIADTKEANNEKYDEIIGKIDLSEVYKKATEELNMVRAENNQVYTYENKKSDMVKQYADIPGADE